MSSFGPSSAPAAIGSLTEHFRLVASELGSPTYFIDVVLGELTSYVADNFLQVLGVPHHTQTPASLGNLRREEDYEIACLARVYVGSTGESNHDPVRVDVIAKVYALVAAVESAITDDPTLGTSVRFAQITSLPLAMGNTGNGWAAEIAFTVTCEVTLERN